MRLRLLGAATLAVLVAGGLTACRTNVGVAATVNGHRITESKVNSYLSTKGTDPSLSAQAKAAGQDVTPPRSIIVSILVEQQLFERALSRHGGIPNQGQLTQTLATAASQQQTPTTVAEVTRQRRNQLVASGVKSTLAPIDLRALELELELGHRLNLQSTSQLAAAVRKTGATVSVNPRYGTWDASTLSVTTTTDAGLPSFVKLQPTGSASPSAGESLTAGAP